MVTLLRSRRSHAPARARVKAAHASRWVNDTARVPGGIAGGGGIDGAKNAAAELRDRSAPCSLPLVCTNSLRQGGKTWPRRRRQRRRSSRRRPPRRRSSQDLSSHHARPPPGGRCIFGRAVVPL